MDTILDSQQEADKQKSLEKARQEFHAALLSQYNSPLAAESLSTHHRKSAADSIGSEIGQRLDRLYTTVEKMASLNMNNMLGQAEGAYTTYAGLSGLLTGLVAYNAAKKRSDRSVVDKALRQRERKKFLQQPPEIYARPEPIESL